MDNIRTTLRDACFPEHLLVLEIAENALVNDEASRRRLHELEDLGIRIARSFVRHLEADAKSRHIVRAVVELCHSLDVKVIAEGIETLAQQDILLDLGCEYGQGFYYLEPKAGYEFRRLLGPDSRIDHAVPPGVREAPLVHESRRPTTHLKPESVGPVGGRQVWRG